jgi:beta-mannosidase
MLMSGHIARLLLIFLLSPICATPAAWGGGAVKNSYGASEERLQTRYSQDQEVKLSGKWLMAGRDPDAANPFGSGDTRLLPNMTNWQWRSVSVPGSVRSGLLEAGVIEDPYWSDNAGKSLWTEKKDWWFKKSVAIPKEWSGRHIFIGFDGIDYYSSVWINGEFLGDHEGMYGGPVYDVTSLLHFGKPNEITVQIHTGGTDEPGKVFKGYIFMKWHYQTDISPRGIWRGVRMISTGPVRLENPFVKTLSLSDKAATIEITVDVLNPGHAEEAVISGDLSGQEFSLPIKLSGDKQTIKHSLRIENPRLWWPHGMGDPSLYRLELQASTQGQVSDSISTTFGIRTIEFEPNPGLDSDVNNRFMCKVNGKLISMRGAGGFGAHDQIYRYHARKDAWFIKVAQDMNFNFIRLHGAGMIATDEFYDLCDRMGMMVWQEFMISNMGISGEHPDVWRAQTVQSILRLRNHPSLIRWCGGNEFNPDATDNDNKAIVDMFDECVAKYDGTRLFNRAAQYVNDPHYNDESGTYGGQNPAACTEYSGAYSASIIGSRSLRKFLPEADVTRWPPVTKEKLDQYFAAELLDDSRRGAFVFHTALTGRLEGWGWPGDLTVLMPQWLLWGNARTMDEAFQMSQVSGGETFAYVVETLRSRWPHPSLYASWDYAPIWPMSIIYGPVDYYGVVLPCAYYYKRAQEPLHVLMQLDAKEPVKTPVVPINAFMKVYEPGEQFKGRVYVVSDLDHPIGPHTIELQIFDSKLDLVHQGEMSMRGMEGGPGSLPLGSFEWDIPSSMPNQIALVCVSLKNESGELVSRSAYPIWISTERSKLVNDIQARRDLGPWLTDLEEAQTGLRITPVSKEARFSGKDYLPSGTQHCANVTLEITNTGDKPAFHAGVEITNADCRYVCDDNYFTLMPGETRRVTVEIDPSIQPFYEAVSPRLIHPVGSDLEFTTCAWNAPEQTVTISVKRD